MATNQEIKNALNSYFSLGEINTLCFDLGIPYEEIRREGKTNTITALIEYAGRRGKTGQVIAYINKARPHAKLTPGVSKPEQIATPPSNIQSQLHDNSNKREKILDAAIKQEVKVGKSTLLLVLIRDPNAKGLRFFLKIDSDYMNMIEEEDVRSSHTFQLYYPVDKWGNLLSTDVEIVITAPDFSPQSQSKIIEVSPTAQSDDKAEPIEFMLTPIVDGNLQIIVEVYQSPEGIRKRIGGKPMHVTSKPNPAPYAKYQVLLWRFGVRSVQLAEPSPEPSQPPIVVQGDYIAGDKVGGDQVGGDKISVGDASGGNAAIGRGGTVNVQPPAETGTTINVHGNVIGGVVGGGTVNAENIAGRDIIIGQEPQNKQAFQEQLAALETLLKEAIESGDIPAEAAAPVQEDLRDAVKEAAKEEPSARRLTGRLEYVQEVLGKAAGVAKAAGKVGTAVLKATPIVAGLVKAASILF